MESECLDLQSLKIRKKVLSTGDCGKVLRLLIGELQSSLTLNVPYAENRKTSFAENCV